MSSHANHDHPNTPAARAACRKAHAAKIVASQNPAAKAAKLITIHEAHCQQCGSIDLEDLFTGDQGYTACCNERVIHGVAAEKQCDPRECTHTN